MSKILVPIDSSPAAAQVLAAAYEFARTHHAELVLLRAIGIPTELPMEAYAMAPDNVAGLLEKSGRAELEKIAAEVPAGIRASVRVEFGAAWQVICDVAKSEDVLLVVMGAHNHRFLDGMLGTTATRVVNHCDRSVLIVRRPSAPVP